MEQAGTFFGRAGEVATSSARWIVLFGRKYPLAAAGYLVFFVLFFFQQVNQSSLPPAPPLPQSSTFPTSSAPSPPPLPSPVVSVAQAQAFRNGDSVIVKWSQPVSNPVLYADGNSVAASCQPQVCTVPVSAQINELQASWQEGGQSFKKKFRF